MALVQRLIKSNQKYIIPSSLTHSAGTITAVINGKVMTVAVGSPAANTLYHLYVRMNGPTLTMYAVTTVPSAYRASYSDAVLIGAYYSNGLSTPSFGSFVDIEGPMETDSIPFDMTIEGSISNPAKGTISPGYDNAYWCRKGSKIQIRYDFYNAGGAGSAGSGTYLFSIPSNLVYDTNRGIVPGNLVQPVVGYAEANNGGSNGTGHVIVYDGSGTKLILAITGASQPQATIIGQPHYNLAQVTTYSFEATFHIVGWDIKPIKDT